MSKPLKIGTKSVVVYAIEVTVLPNDQDHEFVFHRGAMHLHHPLKNNYGGDYLCTNCTVMGEF